MSIYNPTVWINDSPPPINASNLNKMEEGIRTAHEEVASAFIAIGSQTAYASTLFGNIAANGSQIAAQGSTIYAQGNQLATVIAYASSLNGLVNAQAAAVASNTQGVASLLPALDAQGSQLFALGATQGAQASQLGFLVPTQARHSTQIAELQGMASANVATDIAQASQIGDLYNQVGVISAGNAGLVRNYSTLNRSGNGPVDIWEPVEPVGVTATSTVARAIAMRYDPVGTIGVAASGITRMDAWLLPNAGVATALRNFSLGVLDGVTGSVIAWTGIQPVPSVATGLDVQLASYGLISALGTNVFVLPGKSYFLLAASDDEFRLSMLGRAANGDAAAEARFQRGLAYEYALPSGLAIASYGSFILPVSNVAATAITSPVASPVRAETYPAVFVT